MPKQRRFPFFAIMLTSSLAAGSVHADINPRDLVNQAAAKAESPNPGLLSKLSPEHREAASKVLDQVDREALCEHLDVSQERFEEVLGTHTTEMPAVRIALEAMEKGNVKAYCRGV